MEKKVNLSAKVAGHFKLEDFQKWFNHDFWRAFKNWNFPIIVPNSPAERHALVQRVYESVISARYSPNIPETEIIRNKGYGIARTIPIFCIEDYVVYYFCIKELEDVLCGNRTPNTFGGWTLGGKYDHRNLKKLNQKQLNMAATRLTQMLGEKPLANSMPCYLHKLKVENIHTFSNSIFRISTTAFG